MKLLGRFKSIFAASVMILAGAFGTVAYQAHSQNISLAGAFYQFSGIGIGTAPTGSPGAIVASGYSLPASTIIASAATITPTQGNLFHVSGTNAIQTITVPPYCGPTCTLYIIPDAAYTLSTSTAQMATASTAVVGKLQILSFDGTKWNPSY